MDIMEVPVTYTVEAMSFEKGTFVGDDLFNLSDYPRAGLFVRI